MTGLPTWGSGQPGQVGNQAALTVEPVLGSRLVTPSFNFRLDLAFGTALTGYLAFIRAIITSVLTLRSALTFCTVARSPIAFK